MNLHELEYAIRLRKGAGHGKTPVHNAVLERLIALAKKDPVLKLEYEAQRQVKVMT